MNSVNSNNLHACFSVYIGILILFKIDFKICEIISNFPCYTVLYCTQMKFVKHPALNPPKIAFSACKSAAVCTGLYNSPTFSFWVCSFRRFNVKHIFHTFCNLSYEWDIFLWRREGGTERKACLGNSDLHGNIQQNADCIHPCLLRHCLPQKG